MPSPTTTGHPSRHARTQRRAHPMLRAIGVALVGTLAFAVTSVGYAYSELQGNIEAIDVTGLVGEAPTGQSVSYDDPNAGQALNILLLGTDDRSGENEEIGGADSGMRSDTTLLLHISADRTRAEVVSIPRDLLVPIPACDLPDGSQSWAQDSAMFNSAFSQGAQKSETGSAEAKTYGVACTIRTVQAMSGVTIDDFALVDFAGFQTMIDAIGGVQMCIPEDMQDSYTGLNLTAGNQVLDGTQALQYARARHNVGDGSDISRISRQQLLLAATSRTVLSKNLFTDSAALYQFLSAATDSLTTSPGLHQIPSLVGLALSMNQVGAQEITFVTLPFDPAGARVVPNAATTQLWAAIAADQSIAPEPTASIDEGGTAVGETPGGTGTGTDAATATEAAEPSTTSPTAAPDPDATSDVPWEVVTGETDACTS